MEISFVFGGTPITPVFTRDEFLKYNQEVGLLGFSEEDYWRTKGLEINTQFEKEIVKTRQIIGIPVDGLDYEEYLRLNDSDGVVKKADKEVERILNEFDCDQFVAKQLKTVLLSNFVLPQSPNMSEHDEISITSILNEDDLFKTENDNREKAVFIKITSRIFPEAIIEYIKKSNNREALSMLLNQLPEKKSFLLTENQIRVYKMKKDRKFSYDDMAIEFAKSEKDKDIKTSDTIGQHYRRTIQALFHKKTNKKSPEKK